MEQKIEYRALDGLSVTDESVEQDKMLITGYLLKFGEPTVLFKDDKGRSVCEVYDPGCVDAATDLSNCIMRYNHNDDYQVLARTSNDTLKLTADAVGVKVDADIANTQQGRDIYELIRRRDVTAMSAGFCVDSDDFDYATSTRHIQHIAAIIDASVVDNPAYAFTSVDVVKRSIEAVEKEHMETMKKRLKILCSL